MNILQKAVIQLEIDLKIFRMNRLGIPQERIAKRLGQTRETIRDHLSKMATLPNPPNADLSRGFTVPQVAEKHNWAEPMVWSLALEDKEDLERFKALNWGLRTWDLWNWNDCLPREIHVNDKQSVFHWGDKRFGDDWPARHRSRPKKAVSPAQGFRSGEAGGPGRIPAQMIAHILYYFSDQNDLVFDPTCPPSRAQARRAGGRRWSGG